ncbi:heterokaryon incompatibility protein-domain-containing protein [Xylaria acuta]|nr:heterokaryon incompatibility protein-domain-containing protein [Xylaria acuta]
MDDTEGLLCETCTVALRGNNAGNWREWSITHHQDYGSFIASTRNNCFICAWLWARHTPPTMLESSVDDTTSKSFRILCRLCGRSDSRLDDFFDIYFLVSSSWAADFELQVCLLRKREFAHRYERDQPSLPWSQLEARPWSKLDSKIGSTQDLHTLKTWMSRCETKHEYCCKASTFFPARVIDVQDAELGIVRLRNREHIKLGLYNEWASQKPTPESASTTYPPYWTLSHRWGDPKDILQLTKKVEKDFRKSISIDDLSPTFRDATLLVRRLGFSYIWIDSLCIFQDSLSDWQREANDMVNIYRNSHCNISATGASYNPSKEGLFRDRRLSKRLLYPFVVNASLRSASDEINDGPWMAWNDSTWVDEVERAPLSTRGWVVQERFLATRVIHFAQNQIFWECLENIHCGIDPDSSLMTIGTEQRGCATTTGYKSSRLQVERYKTTLGGSEYRAIDTGFSGHRFHREWGVIVSEYVPCNLTKESDRFIAMSGIAKTFRETSGDTYIAGLWKNTIHADLAWESRASLGIPAERSDSYAPTWSWASIVGGQVQLSLHGGRYMNLPDPLIRLVAERIIPDPPGGDVAGSLQSAELDIKCMPHYYRWVGQSRRLTIYKDEKRIDCRQDFDEGAVSTNMRLDTSVMVGRFAEADEIEGVCIPLYGVYQGYGGGDNKYLMLEHESGNRYKRIGLLSTGGIGTWVNHWDEGRSTSITLI